MQNRLMTRMMQYYSTKVILIAAVTVWLSNAEALDQVNNCTGLSEQTHFWKNLIKGYNKAEPPAVDILNVYVEVYITALVKLDPVSRSGKIIYRTRCCVAF